MAAVLVLNTLDDGRLRPKHVEWPCRNKTCTVLHQVGVSFVLNSVTVFLQQKHYLAESLSTCWREYIPPRFILATYDQTDLQPTTYSARHVCKLGSTKTRTVKAQFWVEAWYVSRDWGKPRAYQSQWSVFRPSQKWKQCHQCEWFQ